MAQTDGKSMINSRGFFMNGQLNPYTASKGDRNGMLAYEVADPEPSGNRNRIVDAVLGLP